MTERQLMTPWRNYIDDTESVLEDARLARREAAAALAMARDDEPSQHTHASEPVETQVSDD